MYVCGHVVVKITLSHICAHLCIGVKYGHCIFNVFLFFI